MLFIIERDMLNYVRDIFMSCNCHFKNMVISLLYDYGALSQRHLVTLPNCGFFFLKNEKEIVRFCRALFAERIRVRAGSATFPRGSRDFRCKADPRNLFKYGQNSGAGRGRYFARNYKLSCASTEIVG